MLRSLIVSLCTATLVEVLRKREALLVALSGDQIPELSGLHSVRRCCGEHLIALANTG